MISIQSISNDNISTYLNQIGIPDYHLSFLTTPQLCLVFFNKARNRLVSLLKNQLVLLNLIQSAIQFLRNYEKPIEDSLVPLKVSLLQFDGSGNLKNLDTFKTQVANFLDTLPIKSGSSQNFGQTNIDSQEDIYSSLQTFLQIQKDVEVLLSNLQTFEEQLKGIDLYKVAVRNLSNATRSQIDNLEKQKNDLSQVALASNLLAASSVLEYFKGLGPLFNQIYKPIVSKTYPPSEEIYGHPVQVSAVALSSSYPQTVTHQDFKVSIDGISYSIDFPSTAAKGRAYVLATQTAASYVIPVNTRLYVKVTCPTLSNTMSLPEGVSTPNGVIAVDIPSGVQTFSAITSAITTGLLVADTGMLMTQFGFCDAFAQGGSNRLMIYGKSDVTSIEIVSPPGAWNNITGVYTPAHSSCNAELGFLYGKSDTIGIPSYFDLRDCLAYHFPISLVLDKLRITSPTVGENSSVTFSTSIATDVGFSNSSPVPSYIELKSKGVTMSLASLDIYTGCFYKDTFGNLVQLTVVGNTITLPIQIPPVDKIDLEIYMDLTFPIQPLIKILKGIPSYTAKIEQTLLPLLNNSSDVQISISKSFLGQLTNTITNLIAALAITAKDSIFTQLANSLISQLEDQGLSKLVASLNDLALSDFFAAQINDTSFGLGTMSKMEALNG